MTIAIRRLIKATLLTSCWLISALFEPSTVFDLEAIANPQISPDGTKVLYERRGFDIMTDRATKALWLYDLTAEVHEPVLLAVHPRWHGRRCSRGVPLDD